ncbi:hypothetical protein AHAS_Ahas09G0121600 [Arachis hypogaea]|uniref:RNase H type-1 domain-containing protein n=1 Tax=Arachis hypogaea TaxID=3818 RepID=A0A445BKB3_ARAHY|nr:hypothetical protein Ahy_A09g044543 [Arachis hypogaea]
MIRKIVENYSITLSIKEHSRSFLNLTREELVEWEAPNWRWTKLNVDGPVIHPISEALAELASELGIAKLVVELDSRCVVALVQKASPENHSSSSLIRSIKELLEKIDNVELRHIYRMANFYADAFAKLGQKEVYGIKFFE